MLPKEWMSPAMITSLSEAALDTDHQQRLEPDNPNYYDERERIISEISATHSQVIGDEIDVGNISDSMLNFWWLMTKTFEGPNGTPVALGYHGACQFLNDFPFFRTASFPLKIILSCRLSVR